jgi:hypothetical protein
MDDEEDFFNQNFNVGSPSLKRNSKKKEKKETSKKRSISSSSSSSSSSLFKFTKKYDKNHATDNKAHKQAPTMYTPKHPYDLNHRK